MDRDVRAKLRVTLTDPAIHDDDPVPQALAALVVDLIDDFDRLDVLVNSPHTDDFFEAVRTEKVHQLERWGDQNGKTPEEWRYVAINLLVKATEAALAGNEEKALHHTISTAALMANWHASIKREKDDG